MKKWIEEAKAELGVELDVDVTELLGMTKAVAHNVARPAAPLTAFLVGYAAAQAGGGPAAVADANRTIIALAEQRAGRPEDTGTG
ncbi:MAG: molybdopterin-guanine dinucleotide biosynthesis protein MobA [Actinophytocola sp.]|nr:molybdopterin-guanine dinucleotide biosynthesis protein MobA [Actinophytocola sp.]